MFARSSLAAVIFASAVSAGCVSYADDRPLETTRIPTGRGQFIITQLPAAPVEVNAPYALTGESSNRSYSHVSIRPGIRGQTMVVPSGQ
jgi:hypothetical protein